MPWNKFSIETLLTVANSLISNETLEKYLVLEASKDLITTLIIFYKNPQIDKFSCNSHV